MQERQGSPVSRLDVISPLPPCADLSRLQLELRFVPARERADAVQVAWVAHLEKARPARAVNTWWRRELRRRCRQHELGGDVDA